MAVASDPVDTAWPAGGVLLEAACGHQSLEWPLHAWNAVSAALLARGWQTYGARVDGPDSVILPSYYKAGVVLLAGMDVWSGAYLLATCATGDRLLAEWWQGAIAR